jgi:acyl-coenzyme A synthetase/AMP-(fatty) acid ligase
MIESRSVAPLSARLKMMEEPTLGAGSFLQHALALNPNREEPFVYRHFTDQRGIVVLKGHSLVDLAAIRDQYARWYRANGVRAGEVIGVLVAEGIEPLFHYLALTSIGAIPAMVNDAMPPHAAKRYLDHVGVVGAVADDPTALVAVYRGQRQRPRFIVPTSELRAHDPWTGELPAEYPYRHAADEVVALIHSSGTTGTPKSTMLGHRQFWVGKQPRMVRFPAEPYDRLLSLMPHTHAGGLSYFMTAVLLGLPMVAMAGWRRDVVEPVMKAFQPTMIASFPRTFVELATGPLPVEAAANVHTWFNTGDGAHYGHIRRLVTLGRRPAGLVKPWLLPSDKANESALPGSQFIDGLGSSEMGMALFGQVTSPETERNDRCIGKPLEVVEKAAVLDEQGRELPDGVAGLLGVKTPTRTPGYWNDPEMTRRFELAGYWLTGDVVRKDAEGQFYHLDRTVDVIDTAAGPVYSLPIEEVILADVSDWVIDCAVVGVPANNGGGQQLVATVRVQPGIDAPPASILLERVNAAVSAANLTPVAALVIARHEQDLPTGVTGKVLKRELRTRLATLFTDARRTIDGITEARIGDGTESLDQALEWAS